MGEIKSDHLHCSEKYVKQFEDANVKKCRNNLKSAKVNLLAISSAVSDTVD